MTYPGQSVRPDRTTTAAAATASTGAVGTIANRSGADTTSPAEFAPPPPSRTPQLLRRLQAAAALALLILGALSTWVITELRDDLGSAPALAAQYARLGAVSDRLVEANTLVTRGVLESNGSRSDRAIAARTPLIEANQLLVEAATARPQDAGTLSTISGSVTVYGGLLLAADGRDGPSAQDYLTKAGELLESGILTQVTELRQQLTTEAAARPWAESEPYVPILGVMVAGFLIWISWVVAHRSRRALNLGLIGGIFAALLILGITVAAQQASAEASDDSRDSQFSEVVGLTEATGQLGRAQRLQTQAVLARSWTGADSRAVTTAVDAAGTATRLPAAKAPLKAYRTAQEKLASLLVKGDWTGAAKAVLSDGADQTSALAGKFHDTVSKARDAAVIDAANRPDSARDGLFWEQWAVLLVALVGAGLAVAGLGQRLAEYR